MTEPAFPTGHALVVAIARYQSARPLPEAVTNDAKDIASVLCAPDRCGYDPTKVRTLLDQKATGAALRAELDRLRQTVRPADTVFVYFSGHGWRDPRTGDSRLLPVEADRADIEGTTLSASDFSDALHAIKVPRLIVLLDACHAGGAAAIKSPFDSDEDDLGFSEKSMDLLSSGSGRAVIASSRPEEASLILPGARNSAFTAAVLEGLGGAADFHGEGVVKLFSLFDYVSGRVASLTTDRQHPLLLTKLEQNLVLASNPGFSKSLAGTAGTMLRETLYEVLPALYPAGPTDQAVWERAGGDVSRLRLGQSGRSQWHEALRLIEKGGGGDIDLKRLILEARRDFPQSDCLRALS